MVKYTQLTFKFWRIYLTISNIYPYRHVATIPLCFLAICFFSSQQGSCWCNMLSVWQEKEGNMTKKWNNKKKLTQLGLHKLSSGLKKWWSDLINGANHMPVTVKNNVKHVYVKHYTPGTIIWGYRVNVTKGSTLMTFGSPWPKEHTHQTGGVYHVARKLKGKLLINVQAERWTDLNH